MIYYKGNVVSTGDITGYYKIYNKELSHCLMKMK